MTCRPARPSSAIATPTEGLALSVSTASIIDLDGIDPVDVVFTFQWQVLIGTTWTNIVGETNGLFVPQQAQVGSPIRVAVTYTDDQGTTETVFSAATGIVGDEIIAGGGATPSTERPAMTSSWPAAARHRQRPRRQRRDSTARAAPIPCAAGKATT